MIPHSGKPRTWQVSIIWQGNFHRSRWRRYRLCGFSPEVCAIFPKPGTSAVSFHACPRTIAPKVGILGVGGSNLQRRIGSMCATVGLIFLLYSLDQFATHSYWTVLSWCRQTVVSYWVLRGGQGGEDSRTVVRGLGATTGREVGCWTLVTLAFCVLQSVVALWIWDRNALQIEPGPILRPFLKWFLLPWLSSWFDTRTHSCFAFWYAQLFLKFALPHIVLQCFTPFQGQAEVPHNEISPLGVSQVEFSALKASQALELDHNFKNKSRQESCSECRDISWRRMAGPEFENSKISTPPFCLKIWVLVWNSHQLEDGTFCRSGMSK